MNTIVLLLIIIVALGVAGYFLRDRLSGWKTRIFGYAGAATTGATSVLQEFQDYDWTQLVNLKYAPIIGFGVFAAFLVLREITTGSAGNGHKPSQDSLK